MAGPPHVRAAALHALFFAPAVANAAMPADDDVLALVWLSRCDPYETNAEASEELFVFLLLGGGEGWTLVWLLRCDPFETNAEVGGWWGVVLFLGRDGSQAGPALALRPL